MVTVAAVQYCASDNAAATIEHIYPLIADAASNARLVALPEAATYLAASPAQPGPRGRPFGTSERPVWTHEGIYPGFTLAKVC